MHSEVILGAQGSIQSTLCGIVGVFWCQSTTGCRLNFCPLPKWNSLSSQYELSSTRERYDLHWIPVLFLQSLNKFEHYLTIQRDEWLFWCWGWRKSKCSGREDFQLWQCSRQNGSLIRIHTERAVFTIICITCNLLVYAKLDLLFNETGYVENWSASVVRSESRNSKDQDSSSQTWTFNFQHRREEKTWGKGETALNLGELTSLTKFCSNVNCN